jgi:hypothetical protein
MYIFTLLKCILGIIILLHKIINKNNEFQPRKYLFFLLPSIISIFLYVRIFYIYLITALNVDKINLELMSVSRNFKIFFPSLALNIIISIVIVAGAFSWILYWTFYNKNMKKLIIILLNVITPINILLLFIGTLWLYTK